MRRGPSIEFNVARKRLAKAVSELCLEERDDFVKIRGSFFAGANSPVGRRMAREEEEMLDLERLEGWLMCAWCHAWNKWGAFSPSNKHQ